MNMYYQQTGPADNLKRFFREGSVLANLIIVNVSVWVLVQVVRVIFFLFDQPDSILATTAIIRIFGVPAYLESLVSKPWTVVTYMFLHIDLWHILFNMLWLYWFGRIFQEYLGNKKLLTVYLLGGIAGALVYVAAFNLFPVFFRALMISYALGASASVMAIVSAISFYVPNYTVNLLFLGRVKIIYLAIALFVFDFFMIPTGNAGGHIAHIGGALFGFFYILIRKQQGQNFQSSSFDPGSFFRKKKKTESSPFDRGRPVSDEEYNREKASKQDRIDAILEKISKGGYDSLTREEKEYLFKSSGKR
jgi:membrane associated rhomboid family serine protease